MQTPPPVDTSPPETIRKTHLNHEASVQAIGTLYYVAAVFSFIGAIAPFVTAKPVTTATWLTTALLIVFAFVYFQVGRWLRTLNPRARIPATLLSVFGLFGFPVGTLIGLYVLYLLHSKKGVTVFSPEYRQVIQATPQIRYRTSLLAWLFLGLIVLALLSLIAGGLTLAQK